MHLHPDDIAYDFTILHVCKCSAVEQFSICCWNEGRAINLLRTHRSSTIGEPLTEVQKRQLLSKILVTVSILLHVRPVKDVAWLLCNRSSLIHCRLLAALLCSISTHRLGFKCQLDFKSHNLFVARICRHKNVGILFWSHKSSFHRFKRTVREFAVLHACEMLEWFDIKVLQKMMNDEMAEEQFSEGFKVLCFTMLNSSWTQEQGLHFYINRTRSQA